MKHDIIVIGAGSGGLNIAMFMNNAGFKVLLIDKSDANIGGDCLNFGCVPSKALIHTAKILYNAKQASKFGVNLSGTTDIKKVTDYIKEKQDIIRVHENAEYFRKKGIDVVLGSAKFLSENAIVVNNDAYSAKKIIIATGGRPRELKTKGIEKVKYYTNETIFDIKHLPDNLLVIGSGPVGIEIAQSFRRLGSSVTVVGNEPHFLPKECSEIADVLLKQLKKEGIEFYFDSTAKEFTSDKEAIIIDKKGKETQINFDACFVAIGRELNIDNLNLEKAQIKVVNGKIKVDKYLRTTNKRVLVCGDAVGQYQFTHAAELHAGVIIGNFFSPFKKKLSYDNLSWVTYTYPEIATFGLNEKQIKERGIKYETLSLDLNEDDRLITEDFRDGKMILFISKNRLLGGSVVAPNAGETFQELVLAKSSNLKIKSIFGKIYAYPTASRINKTIISKHYSKKLTPFVKKILKVMY